MLKTAEINIRDPFIVPLAAENTYYLFGTTGSNTWGSGTGFEVFKSKDLENWEGPFNAFKPPADFWATLNFWAPEVHAYRGKFYMFATFKAEKQYRGTQILVSDKVEGPYLPLTERPITPAHWECLDGTLYVDKHGHPWIVFCHEWTQIRNGQIWAMQLSDDLKTSVGRPVYLFSAAEAPWVKTISPSNEENFPAYVTDGPWLHRTGDGDLLMLWSSFGEGGYTMGIARSVSGEVMGSWEQLPEPLFHKDGGHGMMFRSFEGQLYATVHQPNTTPDERPKFFAVKEEKGTLVLA